MSGNSDAQCPTCGNYYIHMPSPHVCGVAQVAPGAFQVRQDHVQAARITSLEATNAKLVAALRKASQLASICTDWNMPEAEIDGEMVNVYELKAEFDAAVGASHE